MKKIIFFILSAIALTVTGFAKTYTADLIPPETIEYTLPEHEDTLKCSLFIEEDGLFGLKVTQLTSSAYEPKIKVTLLDKGKELASFTTEKSDFFDYEFYMLEGLKEGEYTVKIENAAKFTDTSFIIDTYFTPWENVESQQNKAFEGACQIQLGERYKGGIMHSDESDYFSFEMPKDGYTVIDLYSQSLKWFSLYDSEFNLIGQMGVAIDEQDTVFETRCGLKASTYYIGISPDENYQSPEYSLEVKAYYDVPFEKEYNNTHLSATKLDKGKEIRGNLFGADDVDVYSFTLDKNSLVTAKLTDMYLTSYGHYNFSILEADGTPIITRTSCNTYSFEDIELDKGDYYLEVSCCDERNYTAFGYKISFNAKEAESDESDENDENDESTAMPQPEPKPQPEQFDDISPDDWYAEDILTAREKGLIEGSGDNNFLPKGDVTIAEAITMASRMYEKHFGAEITSVDGEKWYTQYIMYGIAAGIINPDDFTDYEKSATRAQMAYIFAGVLKNSDSLGVLAYEVEIPDVDTEHKYYSQIQLLYKLNILNGVDDKGTFLPDSNVTRAESAVIMLRCAKLLGI